MDPTDTVLDIVREMMYPFRWIMLLIGTFFLIVEILIAPLAIAGAAVYIIMLIFMVPLTIILLFFAIWCFTIE